jgi:phosphoglycerate-specific signal transduction histidine kinase
MLPYLPEAGDDVAIVTNAGYDEGPFPTEEEVYQFYTKELSEVFPTGETLSDILKRDAFEWLKEYYQTQSIPFSDVYQTNLEIYLRLRHLEQYCDPEHPRENLTQSTPVTVADDIADATTRMKTAMTRYILFQSLGPYVTEFNRIAGQILSAVATEINTNQEAKSEYKILISHLASFYYNAIWQPIADRIGYYTVQAPSQQKTDETREFRVQGLKSTKAGFFDELDKLRERTNEFDIRFETRTERLPQIDPDSSGLSDVLSLDMDELTGEQAAEG